MASFVIYWLVLIYSFACFSSANLAADTSGWQHQRTYPPHSNSDTNGKFLRIMMLHVSRFLINIRIIETGVDVFFLWQLILKSTKIHLIIFVKLPPIVNITRNATGHIVELRGVAFPVIDWLSQDLNFK